MIAFLFNNTSQWPVAMLAAVCLSKKVSTKQRTGGKNKQPIVGVTLLWLHMYSLVLWLHGKT